MAKKPDANPLAGKAVLVGLTIRRWTGRRLDRDVTAETNQRHNADADAGRFNKLLIPKVAFETINSIRSNARDTHHQMTMPWAEKGPRVLPTVLYPLFTERFRELRAKFDDAADEFASRFPSYVSNKKRLGGMFKDEDYPDNKDIRGMFGMSVRVFEFPASSTADFRVVLAAEQAEDIRREIEESIRGSLQETMREPYRRITEAVGHMARRLKEYKPGDTTKGTQTTGKFRDSLVTNVEELVDLLDAFNLTGDATLTQLSGRIRAELCKQPADALREDGRIREKVAKAAEEILGKAEALMA